MLLTCPICQRSVNWSEPEFPFCSARCRLLDLGNWASDRYRFATPVPAADRTGSEAEWQRGDPEERK